MVTLFIFKGNIAKFYAGDDTEYKKIIVKIFAWECLDIVFSGLSGASNSIFYGFGKTKITSIMSMINLFIFRLPTLILLMYVVKMNYEACGVAMFTSNTMAGIITGGLCLIFMLRLDKKDKYRLLFKDEDKIVE